MLSKIWQLVHGSFKIWSDARASQMAAAMTYYSMLSLAPTLIISIAIASYLFDDRLAEQEILDAIRKFTTPEIAETIAGLIRRANLPKSGFLAGGFSVGIFIFGASGVFSQLYDTFNYIWHVDGKKQGFWFSLQKRGIGILMVLFVGLLLIGALVLNSVEAYLTQLVEGQAFLISWLKLADRGLSFLLLADCVLADVLVRAGNQDPFVGRYPSWNLNGDAGFGQSIHHPIVPAVFVHQRSLWRRRFIGCDADLDLHYLLGCVLRSLI